MVSTPVAELADKNAQTAGELLAAVDSQATPVPTNTRDNFPADSATSSPLHKAARREFPTPDTKAATEKADDAMQGVKGSSAQAAENTKQAASDAAASMQDSANRAAGHIADATGRAKDSAHGVLEDVSRG